MSDLIQINKEALSEACKKVPLVVFSESVKEFAIISNTSSFSKLQRIFAWTLRFKSNAKVSRLERNTSFLPSIEIRMVTLCIVRIIQQVKFSKEIQCLENDKDIATNRSLICLCSFLDNTVLWVAGRLKNAQLFENEKHRVLVPSKHHLTKIMIIHFQEM